MKTFVISKSEIDAMTPQQVDEFLAMRGFTHDHVITAKTENGLIEYTMHPLTTSIVTVAKTKMGMDSFRRLGDRRKSMTVCDFLPKDMGVNKR